MVEDRQRRLWAANRDRNRWRRSGQGAACCVAEHPLMQRADESFEITGALRYTIDHSSVSFFHTLRGTAARE
jgi:hypothetical protein